MLLPLFLKIVFVNKYVEIRIILCYTVSVKLCIVDKCRLFFYI